MNAGVAFLLIAAWIAPNGTPRPGMVAMYDSDADCNAAAAEFVTEAGKVNLKYRAWCVKVPDRDSIIGPGVGIRPAAN